MSEDIGSNIRWTILKGIWWWIAIICLLTASFFIPISVTPSYSSLNESWNGMSDFYDHLEEEDYQVKRLFNDLGMYLDNSPNNLIFIVGSQRDYSSIEMNNIESYVRKGGALLILDDFGSAAEIFKEFGYFVDEGVILEMAVEKYYKSPRCPIAVDSFLGEIYEIILNEVGSLKEDSYTSSYQYSELKTSSTSFLDRNDDGKYDPITETHSRNTFFRKFNLGQGVVALLSDASIVINEVFNEQFAYYDNIPFITDVIDSLLSSLNNPTIIFDESHRFWIPLGSTGVIGFISSMMGFVGANPVTSLIYGAIMLGIVYLSYSRKSPWLILRKRRLDAAVRAIKLKNRISDHGPSYSPTMTLEEIILADIGGMINVYGLNDFLHIYTQERIDQIVTNHPEHADDLRKFQGIKLKTHDYYEVIKYTEILLKKIQQEKNK